MRHSSTVAFVATVAMLAACSDITAPPAVVVLSTEQLSVARATVDDASMRIIAGSDHLAASAELTEAIEAVSRALVKGDPARIESTLRRADVVIDALAKRDSTVGPELDGIRMALSEARRLIDPVR